MTARIRIVVAEPGLDGSDRGASVVARALRDAGMEVIYTGPHQTPEQIVRTVIQEDADALGLSLPSGAQLTFLARTVGLLAENEASDVVLFGAGVSPEADFPTVDAMVEAIGAAKIFSPDATMDDIVDWVRASVTVEAQA